MLEEKEFQTKEKMIDYIYREYAGYARDIGLKTPVFDIDDIIVDEENPIDDDRIGWHDTMYVCVKRLGNTDYIKEYGCPQCIGMCATNYDK